MGISVNYNNFENLRNLMFNRYDLISKINDVVNSKLVKPKKSKYKFSNELMTSNIKNFYMTDSVSRNSPTMSSCSAAFPEKNI